MANLGAACLMFCDTRTIDERATFLAVLNVALLLQDPNRRENGVVSQSLTIGHSRHQIGDGRVASPPQNLHQPEFGFGQRAGFFRWHAMLLNPLGKSSRPFLPTLIIDR